MHTLFQNVETLRYMQIQNYMSKHLPILMEYNVQEHIKNIIPVSKIIKKETLKKYLKIAIKTLIFTISNKISKYSQDMQ